VIGLALMTIRVTRLHPADNLLKSVWFDGGLGVLAIGALLLLWSLGLFLSRRRDAGRSSEALATPADDSKPANGEDWKSEAVRGYHKERDSLFRLWQKDRKNRRS